jgi:tRNA G18 (ribose-2'-O)-methylase SpoU
MKSLGKDREASSARPPPRRIRSRELRHVEALKRDRRKRWRHREFLVEGVRSLDRAVEEGWVVKTLLYSGERGLSGWGEEMLRRCRGAARLDLSPELLAGLSEKVEPSEMLAVVAMRENDPARLPVAPGLLAVVADRPASPGNLGGLLRACDAFGVDGVVITGHACDLYDPRVVRASAGSLFSVPAVRLASHRELWEWLGAARAELGEVRVVGSSAHAAKPLTDCDFGSSTVLVLGNERRGLSAAYREGCDAVVSIPMLGKATSLNLTSAASILLYEIRRRRIIGG